MAGESVFCVKPADEFRLVARLISSPSSLLSAGVEDRRAVIVGILMAFHAARRFGDVGRGGRRGRCACAAMQATAACSSATARGARRTASNP
jgi:hypothetical protein